MTLVSKRRFHRDETIHLKNDPFHSIYAVSSGVIKTAQVNLDGQEWINQFYFQGEILGFDAISLNYYPFSAITVTSGEICQVSYDKFMDYISSYRELYSQFILTISQRLNFGHYPMVSSAEQRVACFLLDLVNRLDVDPSDLEFELTMPRHEIASYLGLATETISRIFTRLQKKQLIISSYRKMKIIDIGKLRLIAQDGIVD